MPLFAAFIGTFFSSLSLFLAKLFAAKVALRIAAVTAIGALSTGLMVTFNGLIAPVVAGIFSTEYGQLLGLIFPPISGTVCAGLITLWLACMTYKLQVRAIKVTANI